MTQKDKNLLLKDLSARLPYNVKVKVFWGGNQIDDCIFDFSIGMAILDDFEEGLVNNIKPYLRPLSSMTEEEVKEIQKINWQFCKPNNTLLECFVGDADDGYCSIFQMAGILDYLNAHHFDYRGLIPMGLALEAPEGMYKTS